MGTNWNAKRVLRADDYDTLELMAEAFGGIGAGEDFAGEKRSFERADPNCPVCAHGLALAACAPASTLDIFGFPESTEESYQFSRRLVDAGIGRSANDNAVRAINRRQGVSDIDARVPFAEWARELNVVRGDK